jgi:hypothetical protein
MKIEFEIEEKMPEIITEILDSDKWQSTVTVDCGRLKRVVLKDFMQKIVAYVDIWNQEIHIKTTRSDATYRIFCHKNHVMCEYIGSVHGLLIQRNLPKLTPISHIALYDETESEQPEPEDEIEIFHTHKNYDMFIHDDIPIPYIIKK